MRGGTDRRIFVQIPAYRDAELAPTLHSLYDNAADPAALRTCVVWQYGPGEGLPEPTTALPNLDLVAVPAERSEGCNWARAIAQRRWDGEPYTLLIDSHHRFAPGWDRRLIDMYERLARTGVSKPLLTAYLPPYEPGDSRRGTTPTKLGPYRRQRGLLVRLMSYPLPHAPRQGPVPAEFLSLHFVFTAGRFAEEVSFDPEVYFLGDEVATSLLCYTHGYDLFHPHVVVGWHRYRRTERVAHWDDHPDWVARQEHSFERLRALFTGRLPDHLGSVRGIADFEAAIMTELVAR
ncbi:GlcNAc-transferase family protein [Nocardia takedensis]|uniref:GlcNAc-transferase family protein n=1 Tax=Nocardia takedensis TaxID=259390 RepID=UPI00030A7F84|nr:GlcNAc-transferase family protein [Nocardia takedensis]